MPPPSFPVSQEALTEEALQAGDWAGGPSSLLPQRNPYPLSRQLHSSGVGPAIGKGHGTCVAQGLHFCRPPPQACITGHWRDIIHTPLHRCPASLVAPCGSFPAPGPSAGRTDLLHRPPLRPDSLVRVMSVMSPPLALGCTIAQPGDPGSRGRLAIRVPSPQASGMRPGDCCFPQAQSLIHKPAALVPSVASPSPW